MDMWQGGPNKTDLPDRPILKGLMLLDDGEKRVEDIERTKGFSRDADNKEPFWNPGKIPSKTDLRGTTCWWTGFMRHF